MFRQPTTILGRHISARVRDQERAMIGKFPYCPVPNASLYAMLGAWNAYLFCSQEFLAFSALRLAPLVHMASKNGLKSKQMAINGSLGGKPPRYITSYTRSRSASAP
jgi:hypothetical protein